MKDTIEVPVSVEVKDQKPSVTVVTRKKWSERLMPLFAVLSIVAYTCSILALGIYLDRTVVPKIENWMVYHRFVEEKAK